MSAYPGSQNSYSPHPHSTSHPLHQQQRIQVPIHSPGGGGSGGGGQGHHDEPMSAHSQQHHGLPPYTLDHQTGQQFQTSSPYNGHMNGHIHQGHGQDGQQRPASVPPSAPANGAGDTPKGNRLRKACDSCSIRKVKCDETGPPCRACAALEIPCTFERPSKRRGPPNRHAEEIKKLEEQKRRKLEEARGDAAPAGYSTPPSPNHAAETLASFPYHNVLNAESICPMNILYELVDDFFIYIHPLCPFPHEQSFRHSLLERDDKRHPGFLALLASMIGALVASFPRCPRKHLKGQNLEHLFPTSISLVDRCHKVAVEARGPGYLDKELRVYDAVTSYFLGLSGAYTFRWKQTRLYFGETLTIIRVLGAHKASDPGFMPIGDMPVTFGGGSGNAVQTLPQVDHIQQEIGRRLFWVMFVGIGSIQQLGSSFGELIMPPHTPSDPYPPLPAEVDDEYITVTHIGTQPESIVSKITGFNLNVVVYLTTMPLQLMELAYGIDEVFDWARQKRVLDDCLQKCKRALENAPPALLLHARLTAPLSGTQQYDPPLSQQSNLAINEGMGSEWQPTRSGSGDGQDIQDPQILRETKRQIQYEIQKANIYASQLGTRSYIVEKYCNLHETHDRLANNAGDVPLSSPTSVHGGLGENVIEERESIVKDLLIVLNSISQVNMEPNGGSFINKIRQIASTLIDSAPNRKGPVAIQADAYLNEFLGYLMRLERQDESGDDDKGWADLRQYQMQFAQAGGFMSEL